MAQYLEQPLSLYSIPVVWATTFYPTTWKFLTIDRVMGFNNVQPRSNTGKFIENKSVSREVAARVERMEGAHMNGNEAFPLWTAAVLAGQIAKLDNYTLNVTSIAYIVLRILYNQTYINHETAARSWLRTTLFFTGLSLPLSLVFKAANKLANKGN